MDAAPLKYPGTRDGARLASGYRPDSPCPQAGDRAGLLSRLHYWLLMAVLAVGAMVPWYTLRLLPLVMIQGAKINIEDALVACAALCAAPAILRSVTNGPRQTLWVCAFLAYMIVPFLAGFDDPGGAFYAVRESRALAFYVLPLAFVAGRYDSRDFRRFAAVYVASMVVATIAAFAHVRWSLPLPGAPDSGPFAVRYLDWSVPVAAFTLGLAGALGAETRPQRLLWAASLPFTTWYLIIMGERTTQALSFGLALLLLNLPQFGGFNFRRMAALAAVLVMLVVLALGIMPRPAWLVRPVGEMFRHWSVWWNDGSLQMRMSEFWNALPRLVQHPLFGQGLGSIISDIPPPGTTGPWRYIASGYGFLLIKTGITGFVLFAGMAGAALLAGLRRLRAGVDGYGWRQTSTGLAGLGVLLLLNAIYPVVDVPEGVIAFSLFFAMLVSPPERVGASPPAERLALRAAEQSTIHDGGQTTTVRS